jgi:glycosyltransferase involved in cell wall biosynthesis
MACGVPCVATDVGDAALIVGNCGRVVPPSDSRALASAIVELLKLPPRERSALGLSARRSIEERYSLPAIVKQFESLYRKVVGKIDAGGST